MGDAVVAPAQQERLIYRAIRYKSRVSKDGKPKAREFTLTPAHGEWPDETYLSFGVDPAGARSGLKEVYGYSTLSVRAIEALPHGLHVEPDDDPAKVQVHGLPLPVGETEALASKIALDLVSIASEVQPYAPEPPIEIPAL